MCLMLYVGSQQGLPEQQTPEIRVESLGEGEQEVAQWFSQPVVQFVGAHTGCSCGFPHVAAESAIDFYEGMWDEDGDRTEDLGSVSALIQLLPLALAGGQPVELYPVWASDEGSRPKGTVQWSLNQLTPETWVFTERFMYVIQPHRAV